MNFIKSLEIAFLKNSNHENAWAMAKYMRNHFLFFGIKTDDRRHILKAIWKENQEEVSEKPREIALKLFAKTQRELQYCALEILIKQLKGNYRKEDIQLIEKLIVTNSWWDSVDTIAKNILGQYLLEYPLETKKVIEHFLNSENMWLNRSAILFQLGYKEKTNFDLLQFKCEKHKKFHRIFHSKSHWLGITGIRKNKSRSCKKLCEQHPIKTIEQKRSVKKHSLSSK